MLLPVDPGHQSDNKVSDYLNMVRWDCGIYAEGQKEFEDQKLVDFKGKYHSVKVHAIEFHI